ncbi:hypothetical protein OIT44_03935 [Weissella ceti]|uniref:Uncharacterized protein n=1 Tax=Weissella ceti TaxID=759620 RepID=A0ABT3E488_9LACO|nr:hypothetical protein [Weissella ceti]MCW0953224.1 hypothetical protein [Weissella ceti]QVK12740.1 hypothetical protein KHQ31_03695 [Weissella ceti]
MIYGIMCASALVLAAHVAYTLATSGWQQVGDNFDAIADKIWHIDNVYKGEMQ